VVFDVAISRDGRRLASASWDTTVKVWDTATGQDLFTYRGHTQVVHTVAFHPSGRRLASGGLDHVLRVWDATRRPPGRVRRPSQDHPIGSAGSAPTPVAEEEDLPVPAGATPHLLFSLGERDYACPSAQVLEVARPGKLDPAPPGPSWLAGTTQLHDDTRAVVDLHAFLSGTGRTNGRSEHMLVVRSPGAQAACCLLVDRVKSVRPVAAGAAALDGESSPGSFVRGVTTYRGRALHLLDLEQLLAADEIKEIAGSTRRANATPLADTQPSRSGQPGCVSASSTRGANATPLADSQPSRPGQPAGSTRGANATPVADGRN
jgi:chemotaxis signal transduction protein